MVESFIVSLYTSCVGRVACLRFRNVGLRYRISMYQKERTHEENGVGTYPFAAITKKILNNDNIRDPDRSFLCFLPQCIATKTGHYGKQTDKELSHALHRPLLKRLALFETIVSRHGERMWRFNIMRF